MTPEEFQRLKDEEKEHLRALKKLQATAQRLRAKHSVQDALRRMLEGTQETLDTHDEMIYRLALETARHEARYELATEDLPEENPGISEGASTQAVLDNFAEQQAEARARELVEHMKRGGSPPSADTGEASTDADNSPEDTSSSESSPDKTIGRM